MRGERGRIERAGAELVFIGNGAPHFAEAFKRDYGIEGPLFTDPSLAAYRAAELKTAAGNLWRLTKNAVRAFRAGFRQGRTQGSAFQLGGVLVVDRSGEVLYACPSREAGDHPPAEDIHAALARAKKS